jgi:hypothetical protein
VADALEKEGSRVAWDEPARRTVSVTAALLPNLPNKLENDTDLANTGAWAFIE